MRSRSSVLVPGRLPWSRSACRTQLDSVCAVQPILAAIDTIAAHCDACSVRCSNTIRTARSRTSLENFGDFDSVVMAPVSQELEPPANPGRFNTFVATCSVIAFAHLGNTVIAARENAEGLRRLNESKSILLRQLAHSVANNF